MIEALDREIELRWSNWLLERNKRGARLVLWLTLVLYPLFGILDYVIAPPELLPLLYGSRAAVTLCTLAMFLALPREVFKQHSTYLTASYIVIVGFGISIMIFTLGGFSSPYYAGLNLVILGAGMLFIWPLRVSTISFGAIVASYLIPNLVIATSTEVVVAITNLFFLLTTAIIVTAAQTLFYRSQQEQVTNQIILERTKADRERALAQLQELDRAKSQFFSNVTHELRTPLTMILSPLESILSGELGQFRSDQMLYLRNVRNNALKLLKLINNLLDLAKIEEKFLKLQARSIDIVAHLEEIIEHTKPLAARKQIVVQLIVSGRPSNLWVDPEKFERVVVNLVSNALKFTEPGGCVTVEVQASGSGVEISITDTGIGIPADKMEAIFQRFSQADASTTRRFGGTGIGLAFAKEIVELHGGTITVRSVEGQGSTFTVHLLEGTGHLGNAVLGEIEGAESFNTEARDWSTTLVEGDHYRFHDIAEATERRIAERGDDSMKSTKVLVVEDTVELLRFIHLQLQESHAVYLAVNGRQGLELALREAPDVIVTDYMMPEMDGVAMIAELRKDPRTAEIPIIMLTAKTAVEDRLSAHGAGADIYLNKPFSPRELRTIIDKLLVRQGRQVTRVMTAQVKSLEVISAGLAHELHNPLSYIKNSQFVVGENVARIVEALRNAELPEAERASIVKRSSDKLVKMVAVADRGIRRIEDVVQLVRRYAREGYPEDPIALPFDTAVADVVELVAPKSDQNVSIDLALDAAGASVLSIPEEMQQVIRNLIQNAVDAVGETGTVKVSTRLLDRGRSVELEVTDDGPGIPADVLPRIFTPFFSTKGPGKGMGVGLAIALQVVQKAGGMIDARNTPGKGATFLVRLPTSVASDAETPVAAVAS